MHYEVKLNIALGFAVYVLKKKPHGISIIETLEFEKSNLLSVQVNPGVVQIITLRNLFSSKLNKNLNIGITMLLETISNSYVLLKI